MKKQFSLFRYYFLKKVIKTKRDIPIYVFGHHKCGTKLLGKVFLKLCLKYGWEYESVPGKINKKSKADVVFLLHSQVDYDNLPEEYIGIHMVRDPRDVIISGFLYHKRTTEEWCINKNFQTEKSIQYPQVPNSQMYRSEQWKKDYLISLDGKSYQEKIKALNDEDAIFFEMNHYGKWTIKDMLEWDFEKTNCLELKFEDMMSNYEEKMMEVFKHCNLSSSQLVVAKKFAEKEDLNRMSKKDIEKHPHISSVKTKKWEGYFNSNIKAYFDEHFSEVLKKYNY
ncbi:hypothetical protein A9Q86_00825 [Flavobacteriales bacterium 33_180_T64]|nr:hypothetical protein A9Q86_00825 [Flavobacteriales bacterium 33_180_T64]